MDNYTPRPFIKELKQYFYYNQYDEEKYPHFRACDEDYEYDMEGTKEIYYIFYDEEGKPQR